MKALVTGGTGFLGTRVVAKLLERGDDVRCLIRNSSSTDSLDHLSNGNRIEYFRGNLGRQDDCERALDGCDTVYHIAAEMKGATAVLFLGNVVATRALVAAALKTKVRRFVLVSSFGVYGTEQIPNGGILDESCPLDPKAHLRDPYSYSKVGQEQVCWEAHRDNGLPLVVVRPSVIYGPTRDCLTSRVGIRVGNLMLMMGGTQAMPYVHVANCASGVALAGEKPGIDGNAFNLVDDQLPIGRELIKRYRREIGPLRTVTVPRWAIRPMSRACEWYHWASRGQLPAVFTRYKSQAMWRPLNYPNHKAKQQMGWKPEIDLEKGLSETFQWMARSTVRREA